jgi:c-di-GMP-binding flagellar brake protein YcgR
MEERRIAYRYKVPLSVVVKRLSPGAEQAEMHVTTRDVSTSGLYFTSNEKLTIGNKLDLSLTLPPEATQGSAIVIDAQARVMRVDERSNDDTAHFGVAAAIDRFNVSRAAVDFALHKAEKVVSDHRSGVTAG